MHFSFLPEKIMLLMSKERLESLQNYWGQFEDGVDDV